MTSKSDDTKAEITISTISPEDAKTRRTDLPESQAINLLRNRFYITGHASGQPKFYDTLNDIGNQLTMHLIPVVLQEIPELSHDYDTVKGLINRLVNDGVIRPLSLETMFYRPHCDPVVNVNGIYFRNLWRPPTVEPQSGDESPFTDFLSKAMGGREEEVKYFIKWLALLVQDPLPKRKPPVAPYIYSNQQGQGKSLLAGILKEVLGESAVKTSSGAQALEDKNRIEFFSRTLFVADEAQLDKKTNALQAFKNLITSTTTDEALKNQSIRRHEVPARIMMLSNYAPAHLERDDRRHFVVRWDTGLRDEAKAKYFNDLINWLDNGGYSIVSHFLANYDVGEWDYAAPAMMTDAKLGVIQSHSSKWEQRFTDFVEESNRWFVDQNHDFNGWVEDGFNLDQLPYILEQLGWQPLLGKTAKYRHRKASGGSTYHRYWFSPDVTQVWKGHERIITLDGNAYTLQEVYELQDSIDEDSL
jgi:hypothetical protein